MKKIVKFSFCIGLGLVMLSCSKDADTQPAALPTEGHSLLTVDKSEDTQLELYHKGNQVMIGYNEFMVRIKELNGDYREVDSLWWRPIMHMVGMQHSCPNEQPVPLANETYLGSMLFQMASNATEYWIVSIGYSLDEKTYEHSFEIVVHQTPNQRKNTSVFTGIDGIKYVLGIMPFEPEIKTQDVSAKLYKMVNMMEFIPVEDYSIDIDPRMPSMGNHSSPNNQSFTYNDAALKYEGKLSLTMSGYWRINLVLRDNEMNIVKGENIDDQTTESTLFWEIEF